MPSTSLARPDPASPERRLNVRQSAFCDEYLIDLCAAKAARRAGYSVRAAKWQGKLLMEQPHIEAVIEHRMALREKRTRIKAFRVLEELAIVALSTIEDYKVGADGEVTLADGAHPDAMRAVSKIKHKIRSITSRDGDVAVEHEVELSLWDKNTALSNAARHLGLLKDVIETRDGTLEDLLRAAAARRASLEVR